MNTFFCPKTAFKYIYVFGNWCQKFSATNYQTRIYTFDNNHKLPIYSVGARNLVPSPPPTTLWIGNLWLSSNVYIRVW